MRPHTPTLRPHTAEGPNRVAPHPGNHRPGVRSRRDDFQLCPLRQRGQPWYNILQLLLQATVGHNMKRRFLFEIVRRKAHEHRNQS